MLRGKPFFYVIINTAMLKDKYLNSLSTTLKTARLAKGLTQSRVAEIVGVRNATVSAWESGKSKISSSLLSVAAEVYGCADIEQLQQLEENTRMERIELIQAISQAKTEIDNNNNTRQKKQKKARESTTILGGGRIVAITVLPRCDRGNKPNKK